MTFTEYFIYKWSTRLQSMYNHMLRRNASVISPFYFLLHGLAAPLKLKQSRPRRESGQYLPRITKAGTRGSVRFKFKLTLVHRDSSLASCIWNHAVYLLTRSSCSSSLRGKVTSHLDVINLTWTRLQCIQSVFLNLTDCIVSVISSDPSCKDFNARFWTVPMKCLYLIHNMNNIVIFLGSFFPRSNFCKGMTIEKLLFSK